MIIYVGAIAILFLFVVMIMNLKLVELEAVKGTEYNSYPLAIILSSFLLVSIGLFTVVDILPLLIKLFDFINLSVVHLNSLSSAGTLLNSSMDFGWDSTFNTLGQIVSLGIFMYTTYGMIIVMLAFILLLAIIGPIVLTYKQARPINRVSSSYSSSSITPTQKLYKYLPPRMFTLFLRYNILN